MPQMRKHRAQTPDAKTVMRFSKYRGNTTEPAVFRKPLLEKDL